jgi:hypothetical protein
MSKHEYDASIALIGLLGFALIGLALMLVFFIS